DLARKAGVSHGTVHRIWRAHALKPHRVLTFKFTTDPEAEDKIYDVVGLYLNPPTHAVVLSLDEKTQIQALSRTQPLLPLRPGLPARQTHDYRRNGLTSLYAALEIASGRGHRRVRLAAHRRRFLALHEATRPSLPWPRTARRPRQLLHPFDTGGPRLAREASQRRISLHAQGRVLAQHGRSLVRHSDA